jgi:hypothetical protein
MNIPILIFSLNHATLLIKHQKTMKENISLKKQNINKIPKTKYEKKLPSKDKFILDWLKNPKIIKENVEFSTNYNIFYHNKIYKRSIARIDNGYLIFQLEKRNFKMIKIIISICEKFNLYENKILLNWSLFTELQNLTQREIHIENFENIFNFFYYYDLYKDFKNLDIDIVDYILNYLKLYENLDLFNETFNNSFNYITLNKWSYDNNHPEMYEEIKNITLKVNRIYKISHFI